MAGDGPLHLGEVSRVHVHLLAHQNQLCLGLPADHFRKGIDQRGLALQRLEAGHVEKHEIVVREPQFPPQRLPGVRAHGVQPRKVDAVGHQTPSWKPAARA